MIYNPLRAIVFTLGPYVAVTPKRYTPSRTKSDQSRRPHVPLGRLPNVRWFRAMPYLYAPNVRSGRTEGSVLRHHARGVLRHSIRTLTRRDSQKLTSVPGER